METVFVLGARLVLLVHLLFIVYAVFGGVLLTRWQHSVWLQLPMAGWAAGISFFGWSCPLTPLEKWFLTQANYPAYDGSFVEHHLINVIYPGGLTRPLQIVLGIVVLAVNAYFYGRWLSEN